VHYQKDIMNNANICQYLSFGLSNAQKAIGRQDSDQTMQLGELSELPRPLADFWGEGLRVNEKEEWKDKIKE